MNINNEIKSKSPKSARSRQYLKPLIQSKKFPTILIQDFIYANTRIFFQRHSDSYTNLYYLSTRAWHEAMTLVSLKVGLKLCGSISVAMETQDKLVILVNRRVIL